MAHQLLNDRKLLERTGNEGSERNLKLRGAAFNICYLICKVIFLDARAMAYGRELPKGWSIQIESMLIGGGAQPTVTIKNTGWHIYSVGICKVDDRSIFPEDKMLPLSTARAIADSIAGEWLPNVLIKIEEYFGYRAAADLARELSLPFREAEY